MKTTKAQNISLTDVIAAQSRIGAAIVRTPCERSMGLSDLTGSTVWCKREYLQRTGSFKERGARAALSLLSRDVARRGVVAASAGNHASGLAWHGRQLGIPVTVVVPRNASPLKVTKCRQLGAHVVLHGESFDETRAYALELSEEWGLAYVSPYDDARVIAGQGTLALELLEQVPAFDAVVVPVGGGGLIAGVITVLRALRPHVRVIGVEPQNAACFSHALQQGGPVRVKTSPTLADGLAVAEAGRVTYAHAAQWVDEVVTVNEHELAEAIAVLAQEDGATVEGAGAAPLAALLSGKLPSLAGKRVVLPLTGGNIDAQVHARVLTEHRLREDAVVT
jgi:threonine dehydratase